MPRSQGIWNTVYASNARLVQSKELIEIDIKRRRASSLLDRRGGIDNKNSNRFLIFDLKKKQHKTIAIVNTYSRL